MDDERNIRIIAAADILFFHVLICCIRFLLKEVFWQTKWTYESNPLPPQFISYKKKLAYQTNCGKVNLPPRVMVIKITCAIYLSELQPRRVFVCEDHEKILSVKVYQSHGSLYTTPASLVI